MINFDLNLIALIVLIVVLLGFMLVLLKISRDIKTFLADDIK